MVDGAYGKTGDVSNEFDSAVNLAERVKTQELEVKSATANLAVDTRRVIEQISNIGKK